MTGPDAPPSEAELGVLEERLARWMATQRVENPAVAHVERDPERGTRRWMMRLEGEEKATFTVWFELRQRSLHAETHLAPAPLEPPARAQEYVLRSVRRFRGLTAWIGGEDAFFLGTDMRVESVDEAALDRLLGSLYEATEHMFRPLMQLGYGERFKG
ncbi:MAG: hypothetical protein M9942_07305 [Microthrixaceae bacterium]|nr:hypothetical protein [Microthrixaceae bacterium]MCO5318231.1 hypothetical protein [Microthrixaceae bacterium]